MISIDDMHTGKSYRLFFNENNPNNRVFHVRAIVDDEWYVVRSWSKRRQGWVYSVEHFGYFNCLLDCITEAK